MLRPLALKVLLPKGRALHLAGGWDGLEEVSAIVGGVAAILTPSYPVVCGMEPQLHNAPADLV